MFPSPGPLCDGVGNIDVCLRGKTSTQRLSTKSRRAVRWACQRPEGSVIVKDGDDAAGRRDIERELRCDTAFWVVVAFVADVMKNINKSLSK